MAGAASRLPLFVRLVADLSGRPAALAPEGGTGARGACVQATAVLQGIEPAMVADAWSRTDGGDVEPNERTDRAAVRNAFSVTRDTLKNIETS